MTEASDENPQEGRRVDIRGTVQGVGMRPWVYRLALATQVTGSIRNSGQGVTIEVFGDKQRVEHFIALLSMNPPTFSAPSNIRVQSIPTREVSDFEIIASTSAGSRHLAVPQDLATCSACLAEVHDPHNRRYHYPFTHCTACGPRLTITRDLPFDRAQTTMAPFNLCAACHDEYSHANDRRFHAETIACWQCGPRLFLLDPQRPDADQEPSAGIAEASLNAAVAALVQGQIVAIKGLGGFHLACDAGSVSATAELRRRKQRPAKPFAVMVPNLQCAEQLAFLNATERGLLTSAERPIVLTQRRDNTLLASPVAPEVPQIGLFLPYTPLHDLILRQANRPLVMTSANLTDEPILIDNQHAARALRGIADIVLAHNRDITLRADDSVVRVVADTPMVLRRSRGYAPRSIRLHPAFTTPVLACGAHENNTFCIGMEDQAYLSPHIGTLASLDAYEAFSASVAHYEHLLRMRPEIVAHDLHPDLLSTHYARHRAAHLQIPAIGVQHHHAHIVAAMTEHQLQEPGLGIAYDGAGYGPDGTLWGGELMLTWFDRYERLATWRPLPLAGGALALRQPWRLALAMLDDAYLGRSPLDALTLFSRIRAEEIITVRKMIASHINCPSAHGVGRLFDAVGALTLAQPSATYQAQLAVRLEGLVALGEAAHYPFAIDTSTTPWQIDWRPTVPALVNDLETNAEPGIIAARFHNMLVNATCATVSELLRTRIAKAASDTLPIVLSGGCFANAVLSSQLSTMLTSTAPVYCHHSVPPGDGGLSLGQAVIANAVAANGEATSCA